MRYLLLVVALFVLVWLLRGALGRRRDRPAPGATPAELIRCAHCGIHLPRADAFLAEGRTYCSEEHRHLGARET